MTIALAIPCSDGVVLASDSMGHAEGIASKLKKIQIVEAQGFAVASSGSEFMTQNALDGLRRLPPSTELQPLDRLRPIDAVLQEARVRPISRSDRKVSPHQLEMLIASWTSEGPSVVHLPDDLAAIECVGKPFIAIGSGAEYASVVFETLAHHFEAKPTVGQAKTLAFRIVSTVCQVSSWGVAPPVQMSVITSDGPFLLTGGELDAINVGVQRWLAVEGDYLNSAAPDVLQQGVPTPIAGDVDVDSEAG